MCSSRASDPPKSEHLRRGDSAADEIQNPAVRGAEGESKLVRKLVTEWTKSIFASYGQRSSLTIIDKPENASNKSSSSTSPPSLLHSEERRCIRGRSKRPQPPHVGTRHVCEGTPGGARARWSRGERATESPRATRTRVGNWSGGDHVGPPLGAAVVRELQAGGRGGDQRIERLHVSPNIPEHSHARPTRAAIPKWPLA